MSTALAIPEVPAAAPILELAKLMYTGGMSSKGANRPEALAVRILAGRELGLPPVQAVNWIMTVNGRAVIWGDAALALIRRSGLLVSIVETIEGEGDNRTALCTTLRKGDAQGRTTAFSVADAKRAGLWTKAGPWTEYPDRQLMWRARGWNLRDQFGDVLAGLAIAEEELDVPGAHLPVEVRQVETATAVASPEPDRPAMPVEHTTAVADDTLQDIARLRPAWLRAKGIDPNNAEQVELVWRSFLASYGVTKAKQLTVAQGDGVLKELKAVGHQQEVTELFEGGQTAGGSS